MHNRTRLRGLGRVDGHDESIRRAGVRRDMIWKNMAEVREAMEEEVLFAESIGEQVIRLDAAFALQPLSFLHTFHSLN